MEWLRTWRLMGNVGLQFEEVCGMQAGGDSGAQVLPPRTKTVRLQLGGDCDSWNTPVAHIQPWLGRWSSEGPLESAPEPLVGILWHSIWGWILAGEEEEWDEVCEPRRKREGRCKKGGESWHTRVLCQPTLSPNLLPHLFLWCLMNGELLLRLGEEYPLWTAAPEEVCWVSPRGPRVSFYTCGSLQTVGAVAGRRRACPLSVAQWTLITSALSANSFHLFKGNHGVTTLLACHLWPLHPHISHSPTFRRESEPIMPCPRGWLWESNPSGSQWLQIKNSLITVDWWPVLEPRRKQEEISMKTESRRNNGRVRKGDEKLFFGLWWKAGTCVKGVRPKSFPVLGAPTTSP